MVDKLDHFGKILIVCSIKFKLKIVVAGYYSEIVTIYQLLTDLLKFKLYILFTNINNLYCGFVLLYVTDFAVTEKYRRKGTI